LFIRWSEASFAVIEIKHISPAARVLLGGAFQPMVGTAS
jgi:hypothetical protein